MNAPEEWLWVATDPYTMRLKVEGGWLYQVQGEGKHGLTTLAFVPEYPGNEFGSYLEQITDALDKANDIADGTRERP